MNSLWSILVTSCCQLSDKIWYNSWQFNRVKDFCSLFLLLASISKVTVSLLPCLLSKEFLYLPSLNNDWMKNVSTIFLTCTSTKTWLMSWILKYWNLKSFWACISFLFSLSNLICIHSEKNWGSSRFLSSVEISHGFIRDGVAQRIESKTLMPGNGDRFPPQSCWLQCSVTICIEIRTAGRNKSCIVKTIFINVKLNYLSRAT